jgi:hypothetical protein
MSVWDGEDRFSLLLLEEDEYYFRDHSCLFLRENDTRYRSVLLSNDVVSQAISDV